LLMVAALKRGSTLQKQCERHHPSVAIVAAQCQRLGRTCASLDVTPLEPVQVRQTDERPRPHRSPHLTLNRERLFEPALALLEQATLRPEPEQRARELDTLLRQRRRPQPPFERFPDILLFDPQALEARHLTVVAEDRQYP